MSQSVIAIPPTISTPPFESMPYDRAPDFRELEWQELEWLFGTTTRHLRKERGLQLQRLLQPISDVLSYCHAPDVTYSAVIKLLCREMYWRHHTYWSWTLAEWQESIGPDQLTFCQRYGIGQNNSQTVCARSYLPALIYFLLPHLDVCALISNLELHTLAGKLFGKPAVLKAVDRIVTILEGWGYREATNRKNLLGCTSYLLIAARSASLEDITYDLLAQTAQVCPIFCVRSNLHKVSRALFALGITHQELTDLRPTRPSVSTNAISEAWVEWCQRWQAHATIQHPQAVYYPLLKVGRWLMVHHPEVTSPEHWTYELAAECVAAVHDMKVGEWTSADANVVKERLGHPLRPRSQHQILSAMRTFLHDCQEWQWIPVRVNPARAFRTPHAIRTQLGPDPRVIQRDLWAKLLWSAMNLHPDDLPPNHGDVYPYPFAMVRALAIVWCFAALRSDEIQRLRVGCIRWQYDDILVPETGEMLPKDAICFLDIPVNKTSAAYTKAVHTLVGKRIREWELVRPKAQPKHLDHKTSELVNFLFFYRGKCVSKTYLNHSLIPHLCRKAGIPEFDSYGNITSHRARASIASQLYNAREPLSLFELKEYLGHKHLSSTQYYARVDPTKLASKVVKAGYLEQNLATIEVLLDQDAVRDGSAAQGEIWKYYDLGHGYCTNDFWAQCKHRMACARCPFYRPKDGTMEQLVEGKANLVRMLEFVKLTEDERLLVTEGIELHQTLLDRLADVPTPVGLTPRELATVQKDEEIVLPLRSIRTTSKRSRERILDPKEIS